MMSALPKGSLDSIAPTRGYSVLMSSTTVEEIHIRLLPGFFRFALCMASNSLGLSQTGG